MKGFTLEHSQLAYRIDFALHGAAVLALGVFLLLDAPAAQAAVLLAGVLAGLLAWTLLEYALHRYVLHGLQPFAHWHAEHHARPGALICTPTVLSATLIMAGVFVPALLVLGNSWLAAALTLGVLAGYFGYSVTHHATHHWRARSAWLLGRKRWHARHHRRCANAEPGGCYGVTSGIWDRLLGSAAP